MPANKEALIRYRAINRCLINKKLATKDELIAACEEATYHDVSWRTVAEDIRAMRQDEYLGYFAPIENVVNQGYRYSDDDYSIDQIPLNSEEAEALSFASRLLKQYSNVGIFSTFSGAVEKLSDKLNIGLSTSKGLNRLIDFEGSTTDGGSKFIQELLKHIQDEVVVNFKYHSFSSGKESDHTLHPYYIREYRNRWYVVGWHETYNQIRTLALERIISITPDYSIEYRKSHFDAEAYYKNAVGISVNDSEVRELRLRVSEREWQYFKSQPIHHSQTKIKDEDGRVEFSLKVILNYELISWLLSMGSNIEILSPPDLIKKVTEEYQSSLKQYES